MKIPFLPSSLLALLVAAWLPAPAFAAEIKVLSSAGVKAVTTDLVPQFERATGNKVNITFEVAAVLKRKIEAGEACDVAILTAPLINDLIKQEKILPNSRTHIAHTGVGVAVRKGAPKPDISTEEALKRTLLNAKSIAYSQEGASGQAFVAVLQRLGIFEELQAKNKFVLDPSPIDVVARGGAEIGVRLVSEILLVPEAELVGPLPQSLQTYVVLTAGIPKNAKETQAAQQFLSFMTSPANFPTLKKNGMEPGGVN